MRAPVIALMTAAGLALAGASPAAQAAQDKSPRKAAPATASKPPTGGKGGKAAKGAKATKAANAGTAAKPGGKAKPAAPAQPPAAGSATPAAMRTEAADIDELRRRLAAKSVQLARRAEVDDVAIEVWSSAAPRKYYVAVSQQGALRRTLTTADESLAWQHFDSFRRMAAAGEVGRPVLLGRMTDDLPASTPAPSALPAEALLLPAVPMTPLSDGPDLRFFGSAVETVRRQRIGEDVVRLVWSSETQEFFAALTRHATVVMMVRSRDAADADRAFEQLVRQAEARASLRLEPAASTPLPTR